MGGSTPQQDLFFFLSLLGGLFILWIATGGPDRTPESGLFSGVGNSQSEIREGQTQTERREDIEDTLIDTKRELERLEEDLKEARLRGEVSPYEGAVTLRGGRARERFAQTEYVELSARSSNTTDIPITGWMLESVITGQRAVIGESTNLPFPGTINTVSTLILEPGDRAYVVTGRSPIGVSFRANKCTGYFEQYQDFSPRLSKQCVDPTEEFDDFSTIPVTNVRLERDEREKCRTYINRNVRRCEIVIDDFDAVDRDIEEPLSNQCIAFIEETYTYSGCVENHRFDSDFYKEELRVFLGSPAELWRADREIIRLLDAQGRTVDILDY